MQHAQDFAVDVQPAKDKPLDAHPTARQPDVPKDPSHLSAKTYRLRTAQDAPPLRQRATGFGLALAVNLLLLLVLRVLGVMPATAPPASSTLVVDLVPQAAPAAPSPAPMAQRDKVRPVPVPPRIPPLPPPKLPALRPLDMIELSREEYVAADIGKLPKAGGGESAGDSEEVGRGPNGEILYAAEWAREPTDAELAGYLPVNAPEGSGLVACKTVPGNRVDDCIELGDLPRGTHLARAVRLAAWQFRVRPPRKNGRPMIGEWVRIRIDYYSNRTE
jgi:periplasmic protein TonB